MIMEKNIVIRADSSFTIGSGHIFRCLKIAAYLKSSGHKVVFICDDSLPGNIITKIEEDGFKVLRIETVNSDQHEKWEKNDFLSMKSSIEKNNVIPSLFILDHYEISEIWESLCLEHYEAPIVAIDDIANRPHSSTILIDQNYYMNQEQRYRNLVTKECACLLGPTYAITSEDLKLLRPSEPPYFTENQQLKAVVFFGGTDEFNYCELTASILLKNKKISKTTIISGIQNQHYDRLEKLASENSPIDLIRHTDEFIKVLSDHDISFSAGGSATWERACLGIPSLCVSLADNQVEIAADLHKHGAISYAGNQDIRKNPHEYEDKINDFIQDSSALSEMSRRAWELVDGKGTERVCHTIMNLIQ